MRPARRVPEKLIFLPNVVGQVADLRTNEGEHRADKTKDLRCAARRQDAHNQHDQQG